MVTLWRMDWPSPLAKASRISGRPAWFSMVRGSDCESARTKPSGVITVTRAPLAAISATHFCRPLISSGFAGGMAVRCGGRACAMCAMAASCAKAMLAESSRRARSAKKSTASRTPTSKAKNVSVSFQKRLCRTGFEQVPGAANGLQVDRILGIAFDFFAQAADVHVHAARSDETVSAPDGIEKLVARENTVRPRSKVIEQPEFERAERNGLPGMTHAIRRRIDGQLADFNGAGRVGRRLRAAEQRFDACQQFTRAERLGDVIVGAHLEAHDAVGFFATRGEHEDGETIERVIPANFPADIEAGNLGKHEVEKQEIRRRFLQGAQAAAAVERGIDLKTFVREIVANQFDDIAVVFDDQDAFHAGSTFRPPACSKCTVGRRNAEGIGALVVT